MKKSITNKINKFYLKCLALDQEYQLLLSELEKEQEIAQKKFDEVEAKYDATDEPSDALCERYSKQEEELSDIDDLVDTLSCASCTEDICAELESYTDLPDEYKLPKLTSEPRIANKFFVHVVSRKYIKVSDTHILKLETWTDVAPIPKPYELYWSNDDNLWRVNDGSIPWLGGGDLFKHWMSHKQELFSQLYNDQQDLTATFTREPEEPEKDNEKNDK